METIRLLFKLDRAQRMPWQKMFICALAGTLPLALGHWLGHRDQSVLGSLFAVALTLNDHPAKFTSRIKHLTQAAFFLISSYIIGALVANDGVLFFMTLAAVSFLLGKIKGKGIELERILLFVLLNIITIAGLKMPMKDALIGAVYSSVNFVFFLTMLFGLRFCSHESENIIQKRAIFKKTLQEKHSTFFALQFSLLAAASYLIGHQFHLSREYWIAGTIIIVMIPNHSGSYLRAIQRFLGTIAGIFLLFLLMAFINPGISFYLAFIFLMTFFIPGGMSINFFLGNTLVSAYVMCLIQISLPSGTKLIDLALLRATDIFIGGAIVCLGTYFIQKLNTYLEWKKRA